MLLAFFCENVLMINLWNEIVSRYIDVSSSGISLFVASLQDRRYVNHIITVWAMPRHGHLHITDLEESKNLEYIRPLPCLASKSNYIDKRPHTGHRRNMRTLMTPCGWQGTEIEAMAHVTSHVRLNYHWRSRTCGAVGGPCNCFNLLLLYQATRYKL